MGESVTQGNIGNRDAFGLGTGLPYDGPLTIATDLMVWNVTKDAITMREAVVPDRVTPPSTTDAYKEAPRSGVAKMSEYVMAGVWKGFEPPPLPEE